MCVVNYMYEVLYNTIQAHNYVSSYPSLVRGYGGVHIYPINAMDTGIFLEKSRSAEVLKC